MPVISKGDPSCGGTTWNLRTTPPYGSAIGDVGIAQGVAGYPYVTTTGSNMSKVYDGAWHLVAYTYDAANSTAHVFMDGAWTSSQMQAGMTETLSSLVIGPTDGCVANSGQGETLDDIRIWNRALSVDEINALVPHSPTTTTVEWPDSPLVTVPTPRLTVGVRPTRS